MHKTLFSAALLAAAATAPGVRAQNAPAPVAVVDCSLLSGQPFVCVRNETRHTITNVTCVGNWGGKTPVSLPSGSIRPGVTAVVKFGSGRCDNQITVVFQGRNPRVFQGFDVETNTLLPVSDE